MKIKKWKSFNEYFDNRIEYINEPKGVNHFLQLKEAIEDIKDILIELVDNDISYRIYPNDDLEIKKSSLVLRGLIKLLERNTIYVKIQTHNFKGEFKNSWFYHTLEHLENYIKNLDLSENGLSVEYELSYPIKTIYDLNEIDLTGIDYLTIYVKKN